MTDTQLWEFFGRRCDPSPEPNDEWNARAKAAILSDDLPSNASSEMTAVDAARYICRLLRVLQEVAGTDAMLSPRDPTAGTVRDNQVRAAFVRGIALRGGDPMEASLLFTRGMEEAELRELVEFDLISPGREDCLLLTGTGRVVAEVVVASDRGQGVQGTFTKLEQAALDGDFSEWVRNAVERFAKDYDLLDAKTHTEVFRQYQNLYEDFVAQHFHTDDGPIWIGGTEADVELAMREDFENTEKFRAADAWSKNGSRCLSCGRDFANRPIDLATLTEDACRTLAALYLMSKGDSVLLASKPPDWNEWRWSDDKVKRRIAWMVDGIDGPSDDRFKRIWLVIERVLSYWNRIATAKLPSGPETGDRVPATDNRSVVETRGNSQPGDTPENQLTAQEANLNAALKRAQEKLTRRDTPDEPKPSWDRIKGVLSFNGEAIKKIRRIGVAKNVVLVLDSFQEEDWPFRVDSPLSPGSQKHHATISSLNTGLSRIRFKSDGEGDGFIWETL